MITEYQGGEPISRAAVFGLGYHGSLLHSDLIVVDSENNHVNGVAIVRNGKVVNLLVETSFALSEIRAHLALAVLE